MLGLRLPFSGACKRGGGARQALMAPNYPKELNKMKGKKMNAAVKKPKGKPRGRNGGRPKGPPTTRLQVRIPVVEMQKIDNHRGTIPLAEYIISAARAARLAALT